ncbi:MAG: hypothetical protein QM220_02275 [Atribacterota bacterium]|jgi:uncharacterized protein YxeA|nr:hypothetical protein [Atribacterota bacterium]MDD4765296.1 hypothetical protein [Atribacterota bacterium]MDI9596345.1 hypothetical protein [Atribacterota bacterium]
MKKNILIITMTISVLVLLIGCSSLPTTPSNTDPNTYTIKVISNCENCFGNVKVGEDLTGHYLQKWDSVSISDVPAGAEIRLEKDGWLSHIEIFNPANGTNITFNDF